MHNFFPFLPLPPLVFLFQDHCQRFPVLVGPTLITCLMTRVGIAQKLQGVASSVAKLGVVTPINNSLVSLLQFPSYMNESVNISLLLCFFLQLPSPVKAIPQYTILPLTKTLFLDRRVIQHS